MDRKEKVWAMLVSKKRQDNQGGEFISLLRYILTVFVDCSRCDHLVTVVMVVIDGYAAYGHLLVSEQLKLQRRIPTLLIVDQIYPTPSD